jgi:hypothetical protein
VGKPRCGEASDALAKTSILNQKKAPAGRSLPAGAASTAMTRNQDDERGSQIPRRRTMATFRRARVEVGNAAQLRAQARRTHHRQAGKNQRGSLNQR